MTIASMMGIQPEYRTLWVYLFSWATQHHTGARPKNSTSRVGANQGCGSEIEQHKVSCSSASLRHTCVVKPPVTRLGIKIPNCKENQICTLGQVPCSIPIALYKSADILESKVSVIKSPRLAAIGVATLSGLILYLRDKTMTPNHDTACKKAYWCFYVSFQK